MVRRILRKLRNTVVFQMFLQTMRSRASVRSSNAILHTVRKQRWRIQSGFHVSMAITMHWDNPRSARFTWELGFGMHTALHLFCRLLAQEAEVGHQKVCYKVTISIHPEGQVLQNSGHKSPGDKSPFSPLRHHVNGRPDKMHKIFNPRTRPRRYDWFRYRLPARPGILGLCVAWL